MLMAACHSILFTDSEENGMVSHRILFDIHKTYKQALEEQSGPFFTWLQDLYTNLPQEYAARLGSKEPACLQVAANQSFKLASEVALMIVFLFQCYPRRLQENADRLLPLMVQVSHPIIPYSAISSASSQNIPLPVGCFYSWTSFAGRT